jgi:hypothetical protein
MQRLEHRAGDVPVEIMGFEVKRVSVGKQTGKTVRDLLAILLRDADVDLFHVSSL